MLVSGSPATIGARAAVPSTIWSPGSGFPPAVRKVEVDCDLRPLLPADQSRWIKRPARLDVAGGNKHAHRATRRLCFHRLRTAAEKAADKQCSSARCQVPPNENEDARQFMDTGSIRVPIRTQNPLEKA